MSLWGAVQPVEDSVVSLGVPAIVDHYRYADGLRLLIWSNMEYFTSIIY